MIGRILSHYRIEAPLGAGGMGVVFRARDLHLDRDVALKLLPEGLLSDDEARKRFRREALTLSRLHHAHINVVHDFDVEEDTPFLVMELVPGGTLRQRIAEGPLEEPEVVRLGIQIAQALEAAHEAGVLHRDLKPDNIMITPRGEAKVLDFGLARRFGPAGEQSSTVTMTQTETLAGTVPYMAPELLAGQPASVASDLYALGVTLYEMAAGRRPFVHPQSFALANAIMNEDPPPLPSVRPGISSGLDTIVRKCLARDPAVRYRSARELIHDLRQPVAVRPPRGTGMLAWIGAAVAAVAAVALLVIVAGLDLGGWQSRLFGGERIRSIAVLPLENLSGDPSQEYFADGMTEELTTALAQMQDLSVISRTSAMTYKGSKKALRQIARELNVQAVVQGSVTRSGNEVRIDAQLVDARSDRNVWAQSYQRAFSEILTLQNQVALAIADKVKISLSPKQRTMLAATRTVDPAAHEAYLKGRYYLRMYTQDGSQRALRYFQQALAIDSTMAEAYAGVAASWAQSSSAFLLPTEAMPKAKQAAARALALDPNLAEAQEILAYIHCFYDWHWAEGEREFQRAIELSPSESRSHLNYGYMLTVEARYDQASRELTRAHQLDPLAQDIALMGLFPLYEGRQFDRTARGAEAVLRDYPDYGFAYIVLGQAHFFLGRRDSSLRAFEKGYALTHHPAFLAWESYVWAKSGRPDKAREVYRNVKRLADSSYVQPYYLALMHAGLGEKNEAFAWLDKALANRDEELTFMKGDPGLDPLRPDPRYAALLRQVGLP